VNVDYLVVGSGLTGSVIARMLADEGREVLVVDRRNHLGGNVHDHTHHSGIRIHTYGPHYFRTSSDEIWDYVRRFGQFYHYEAEVLAEIENRRLYPWPLQASDITELVGSADWELAPCEKPQNLREAARRFMPEKVFDLFVRQYNEKQWGVDCKRLGPELCRRFDVRTNEDRRLTPNAKYQGIPLDGYASWMTAMLTGIPVLMNYNWSTRRTEIRAKKCLVYTGPIDEYFDFHLGKLDYRSQRRNHVYYPQANFKQLKGQINNPLHALGPHIRTLEWKHMLPVDVANKITGTVLTTETPYSPTSPNDYEYPFPDSRNAELYGRYREIANAMKNVVIAGRLGEYKYLDMDQAIGRAMLLADRLMGKR
jgi:UDP-galactopyranose mutase